MKDLPSDLKSLSINETSPSTSLPDSWEDEALSTTPPSPSNTCHTQPSRPANEDVDSIPSAPPPTPISPTYRSATKTDMSRGLGNSIWENPYGAPTSPMSPRNLGNGSATIRPEKTTAAAGRMIAAGLGVKQPKKSEESKAYEKAVREKERRTREMEKRVEKERLEALERAKKSVWED